MSKGNFDFNNYYKSGKTDKIDKDDGAKDKTLNLKLADAVYKADSFANSSIIDANHSVANGDEFSSVHPFTPGDIDSTPKKISDDIVSLDRFLKDHPQSINQFKASVIDEYYLFYLSNLVGKSFEASQNIHINHNMFDSLKYLDPTQLHVEKINTNKYHAVSGVEQGGYGDCWFEASLADLASTASGVKEIANMITLDYKGDYEVKFPGFSVPIIVTRDDLNELELNYSKLSESNPNYSKLNNSSQWANILEAAAYKVFPEYIENGACLGFGIKLFTDKSPRYYNLQENPDEIIKAMEVALKNNQPVLAAINEPVLKTTENVNDRKNINDNVNTSYEDILDNKYLPLLPNHAYSVLKVNLDNQSVTLRNPHGFNYYVQPNTLTKNYTYKSVSDFGDGLLVMPLSTFKKYFSVVATTDNE